MSTSADVESTLGAFVDPQFEIPLSQAKMLKGVTVEGAKATVKIELPTPAYPNQEQLKESLQSAVREKHADFEQVDVEITSVVRGKESGAKVGLKVKNVIAVGSGKGGVGKSTVAASLAYGLKHLGASVGLMDADVYGPSVPHLLGATGQPAMRQIQAPDGRTIERIVPIEVDGIKLMSMGFMVGEDQAIVWRGPMLHKALSQFLQQTEWGELDYLVVDMPPGTGDVALTLSQMVQLAGAVIVCTPQKIALLDAGKAISMFQTVKIPILGMVENMTGDIFGRGGAKTKAEEMGVAFLGEIPSASDVRIKGDEGKISALVDEESSAREAILEISSNVAMRIAKEIMKNPTMPTLEIL
ncbi:Mrp/NBP35 family ATP-binding protein [Thalassoglobus polymorphus]|uniref:Iron-sulfur cluster carrier protein n=1 Tax=Thalassoglobus polymorphus TaxID=2527994 RepID=A0A517QUB3_9PLAN|nr:Mrp/NBP35 family ATP-binding protein [Thalassoglobus polymorphus]QDT35232.1 Flagellum site-determining protein YlxH [Thalassoglobus polymorphus]